VLQTHFREADHDSSQTTKYKLHNILQKTGVKGDHMGVEVYHQRLLPNDFGGRKQARHIPDVTSQSPVPLGPYLRFLVARGDLHQYHFVDDVSDLGWESAELS
jgi:hypothetical protein